MTKNELMNCPDCNAEPGQPHTGSCDVERCSVCGDQRFSCDGCIGHDKNFARWTGIWPGKAEAEYLGIDLNTLYAETLFEKFFIKPNKEDQITFSKEAAKIVCEAIESLQQVFDV